MPTLSAEMNEFTRPRDDRYFEDYVKGSVHEYGPISASAADIIEFAKKFDPQVMHTDPEGAARGPFGGLIAGGWHTVALMGRVFVDHHLSTVASLASPGADEVRWRKPLRPDEPLRIRVTTLDTRPSASKPDRGLVTSMVEALNVEGEVVASMKLMNFLARRAPV